jgi:hypothetical protein
MQGAEERGGKHVGPTAAPTTDEDDAADAVPVKTGMML